MIKHTGITLIGQSGAGKTTLAPILSQKIGWRCFDLDFLMSQNKGVPKVGKPMNGALSARQVRQIYRDIADILAEHGPKYLAELETATVASLDLNNTVLSAPGSIIYDTVCYAQLKEQTTIVWLDVPHSVISERCNKDPWRVEAISGIEMGLEELLNKRNPLYAALADVRIDCAGKNPEVMAQEIVEKLGLAH